MITKWRHFYRKVKQQSPLGLEIAVVEVYEVYDHVQLRLYFWNLAEEDHHDEDWDDVLHV